MTENLIDRLREYRPRDSWGDPVNHTICDEAADEIERLTRMFSELEHELGKREALRMFEIVKDFELEAIGSGRQEWIRPTPAPRCKLAIRKDTKEWCVATGFYYKPLESIDGTVFRDSDGCTWRLLRNAASPKSDRL